MDLKSTYNKIAKDWMSNHNSDTWWKDGTAKYSSFLNPQSTILDVGSGAGQKAKYFVEKGFEVTGIDFSEKMVELAKKQVPTAKFFTKDIKQPLEFETLFDGVFAQAVLLHIPKNEILDVLKNIITPLKDGGYLYIAVKELKPGSKEEVIVKENVYGYDFERFFSYFTLEEMKKYLDKIKLIIVYETITKSPEGTNWIQIIAKK